jgi:hypothetical protein
MRFDEIVNLDLHEGGSAETQWEKAQQLVLGRAQGVKYWGLSAVGDTAYLCGFTEHFVYVFKRAPTDPTWSFYLTQLAPEGGINPEAAIGVFDSSLKLIYTPPDSSEIFTASGVGSPGDIVNPEPISPNGIPAKTNKAPAALQFTSVDGSVSALLIAYKDHSSDKLFFAYAV